MKLFSRTKKKRPSRQLALAVDGIMLPTRTLMTGDVMPAPETVPIDNPASNSDQTFPGGDSGWDQATGAEGDWGPGSEDLDIPGHGSMISDSITWILEPAETSDWVVPEGMENGHYWGPGSDPNTPSGYPDPTPPAPPADPSAPPTGSGDPPISDPVIVPPGPADPA